MRSILRSMLRLTSGVAFKNALELELDLELELEPQRELDLDLDLDP